MRSGKRHGFTLVELAVGAALAAILVLTVGILMVSGQKAWLRTYESVNGAHRQDAHSVRTTFGGMGRRANRLNYALYKVESGDYVPAVPETSDPEENVFGEAVEFRYWDVGLDQGDTHNLLDESKTATAYAFFYFEGTELRVDYGKYPAGAVIDGNRNTSDIHTVVLAENAETGDVARAFSHTTINGVGQGCVRINVRLLCEDGTDGTDVFTSTMLRNIWPK